MGERCPGNAQLLSEFPHLIHSPQRLSVSNITPNRNVSHRICWAIVRPVTKPILTQSILVHYLLQGCITILISLLLIIGIPIPLFLPKESKVAITLNQEPYRSGTIYLRLSRQRKELQAFQARTAIPLIYQPLKTEVGNLRPGVGSECRPPGLSV